MPPLQTKEAYQIGIICALPLEAAAMIEMLDETHPELLKDTADPNQYTLGRIGKHNVVIACLPSGLIGNGPAAVVASNMRRSFPIKLGLIVGIGGGVWSKKNDIRLGDVIVGDPTNGHGGVIQWDYGKTGSEGLFRCTGHLNKPPVDLLHALGALKIINIQKGINFSECLGRIEKNKRMAKTYKHQGLDHDQLFHASYDHQEGDACDDCGNLFRIIRPPREDLTPEVHYGNIASGNQVMKHGETRDRIAKAEGVICFEMEAAGLMDNFPCLIIRGVCDYADSHKNKTWQPYAAATAAAFSRILLGFVNQQEIISIPKTRRVLPFSRNANFVGRQSYVDQLLEIFLTGDTEESCQRAALYGLGGIGKTQIALEFAFQLQKLSPGHSIFWVDASNVASFEMSYRRIGTELEIPGLDDPNANVKGLVKAKLSETGTSKWLLIIDNADALELFYDSSEKTEIPPLSSYLPFNFRGGILVTTRDSKVGINFAQNESNRVEVMEMDDSESSHLLQTMLDKQRLLDNTTDLSILLELLANLPLAIVQATAYMNQNGTTVSGYLAIYTEKDDNVIALLREDFNDERRYPNAQNPIAKTWLISFRQIQQRDPLAAKFLAFIACIKRQDIPEDIFPFSDLKKRTESIGTLMGFAFLRPQIGGRFYDMHRLVHLATRNWLNDNNELLSSTAIALEWLSNIIPSGDPKEREKWTPYLQHGISVAKSTYLPGTMEIKRIKLWARISRCQWTLGRFKDAESSYRTILELRMKYLGEEHPHTLEAMINIGSALSNQGRYAESESLRRETLELTQKILGTKHHQTLRCRNDIAVTFQMQGNYLEAELIFREIISWNEELEDPHNISYISNLARTLGDQGKYAEAENMHRKALALQIKVLGENHPTTLQSMNDLAFILICQRSFKEAEIIHKETLALRENLLGKEHPDTLATMNDIGVALSIQGKHIKAENISQELLALRKIVSGVDHPGTLICMNNLANAISGQGRHSEAEILYRETLALTEKKLGKENPYTMASMNKLAVTLGRQERWIEAETMHRNTLALREKVLGKDHVDTLVSKRSVALALGNQGKHVEAEIMFRDTLALQEKLLGKEHLDTIASRNIIALALRSQGKHADAEIMFRDTLALQRKVLGKDHVDTLASINNVAMALGNQGKHSEAEAKFRQALAAQEKVLGKEHSSTLHTARNLEIAIESMEEMRNLELSELRQPNATSVSRQHQPQVTASRACKRKNSNSAHISDRSYKARRNG